MDEDHTIIDSIDESKLDNLPFGVLQLDEAGTVRQFNAYEAQHSGFKAVEVLGKNFFRDIAPCTSLQAFESHFHQALAKRELERSFRYYFPFKNARTVTVTLSYSARHNAVWVLIVDDNPKRPTH